MANCTGMWVAPAKGTLRWLIDEMGAEAWVARRAGVVQYFSSLSKSILDGEVEKGMDLSQPFRPLAVYDDWIAWYMYLVESLVDRPACDEPLQSGRIYPVFAAIGRDLALAKQIDGIETRLQDALNRRRNQPDSTLFEMLVAICYRRNGWNVRFIPEGAGKSPDLEVSRGGITLFVECKRLAKVTDYGERERREWVKRWQIMATMMRKLRTMAHVKVKFTAPVESAPENSLARAYVRYVKEGGLGTGRTFITEWFEMSAKAIDMKKVGQHFEKYDVRHCSPQLIALLAGEYDLHGSYTHAYSPTEWVMHGEDDGLHVLNLFVRGLNEAYSAQWECVAEESLNAKAKDVRTTLARAMEQIPDGKPGVVHIGYETTSGPLVEFRRHEKIIQTVRTFEFGRKHVISVFCHALQLLSTIDEFECAETTSFFGPGVGVPEAILPDDMLLGPRDQQSRSGTHWAEDHARRQ